MKSIIVELEDNKALLLKEKAKKYGLLPDQFVLASIEDILAQPDKEFEAIVKRIIGKNSELYEKLA
jgi:hypothetical protein